MKELCNQLIDEQSPKIIELSNRLFETPELGFKEQDRKSTRLNSSH